MLHHECNIDRILGDGCQTWMSVGVYTIADEGSEARLMYELEIPEEPQELQEQLNIGKTGDYSLQMKACVQPFFISSVKGSVQRSRDQKGRDNCTAVTQSP